MKTKKFSKWVKSNDMIGHNIALNFNKKGDSHTTLIGGVVSILVKVIMSTYIYLSLKKLYNMEDENIDLRHSLLNSTS